MGELKNVLDALLSERKYDSSNISISDIRGYLKCRRAWSLGKWYPMTNNNFEFGKKVHKAIELYHDGKVEDFVISTEQDKLVNASLVNYIQANEDIVECAPEVKFSYYEFKGQLDGIAIKADGSIWVVEHKTAKDLQIEHLHFDPQVTMYMILAEGLLDKPISGVIYNIMKKSLPEEPAVLKKGDLSKANLQKTTFNLYMKKINDLGLNPADYKDVLDILSTQENSYFKQIIIERVPKGNIPKHEFFRTEEQLERAFEDFDLLAKELKKITDKDPVWMIPTYTRDCTWCDYRHLCHKFDCGDNFPEQLPAGHSFNIDTNKIVIDESRVKKEEI